MAEFKEWTTSYPATQDPTPVTGVQPQLENDPTGMPPEPGQGDATRVSQIHTLRDKLQALALKLGDDSELPAGSALARITALEDSQVLETLQGAYDRGGAGPQVIQLAGTQKGIVVRDTDPGLAAVLWGVQKHDETELLGVYADRTVIRTL